MGRKLHIAKNLALPLDAVTGTFVICGIRGSGKSTTAVDMAEEMLKAKQQIVVLDPKDDWWGLQSSASGGDKGFPITILGGSHKNAPLESTSGKLVADLIVEEHLSCILSMKHFSDGERFRFAYDLALRLYQTCKEPTHLFIDEADQFAPQEKNVRSERGFNISEAAMLGLVRRLIKQGRTGGIGVTLITQSPATLDKRVMNMAETMILMRTIGKQDREQVGAWVSAWAESEEQHAATMKAMVTFKTGEGLFWSPSWLGIYKIAHFRAAETFDSRSTPKVGERRVEPKILAPVDLRRLTKRMAETIERDKANDPTQLRKQIVELKADAERWRDAVKKGQALQGEARKAIAAPKPKDTGLSKEERKLVAADKAWHEWREKIILKALEAISSNALDVIGIRQKLAKELVESEKAAAERVTAVKQIAAKASTLTTPQEAREIGAAHLAAQFDAAAHSNGAAGSVSGQAGPKTILTVLAQRNRAMAVGEIMRWADYTERTVQTYLSFLRGEGLIDGTGHTGIRITEAGLRAVGEVPALPTGDELRRHYLATLDGGPSKVLEAVCRSITKIGDLMEATGYTERTLQTYLSDLRQRRLISGTGHTGVKASEDLYG